MASKSILLTGLALGNESGLCLCSNLHTEWLFTNPQDLLWVDNIVVTRREKVIIDAYEHSKRPYDKAVWLIFQYLNQSKTINIIDDSIITESDVEHIKQQVVDDIGLICPEYLTGEEHTFLYKKHHYCQPALHALYAGICLSFKLGTTISMDSMESDYFRNLFALKYYKKSKAGKNIFMGELLKSYLPEIELGHHFLYESSHKQCKKCANKIDCKTNYLSQIEQQIKQIILYRERDEVRQLCETIDEVIDNDYSNATIKDIELYKKQIEEIAFAKQQKMRRTFREYNKWKPLVTCASVGLTVAGLAGKTELGVAGVGLGIFEKLLSQYAESIQKKNSWVNLVTDRTICHELPKPKN
ncbi:MAG: hypothetical protein IJQ84_04625 [Paludibacteraceae bacterium]|nr:hypothetical protein [Paludibacteraceae bacterium]